MLHLNAFFVLVGLTLLALLPHGAFSKQSDPRNFIVTLNPQCNEKACQEAGKGSFPNLVHLRAPGNNDTLHFFYSSIGEFSIMLFKTSLNANFTVNWTKLLSTDEQRNAITFNETPFEASGQAIPIVYEFNDVNGTADINRAADWILYKTSELVWEPFTLLNSSSVGYFRGSHPNSNGSFVFNVTYLGKNERASFLPHLLLDDQTTAVDVQLDSLGVNFNFSKFAVEVIFLTELSNIKMSSQRTLDDEYTPGTFRQWNVEVSDSKNVVHSFFQWKPVFYYQKVRSLEESFLTKQYDLTSNHTVTSGLGAVFFDTANHFTALNVSFGLQGDRKDGYYYDQSNFSVWTFTTGVGAAPIDKMSPIVTLVIFIGFGLPALIILSGLVVMIVKKVKRSRHSDFSPL